MTSPTSNSTSNSLEPEAYQVGHVPFLGTTIWLDSKPLIPRTETEWWTEKVITEIQKLSGPRVLDLFAGSGCVGVAVLKHVPSARVTFGEFDARHLSTIERNVRENRVADRAHITQTDVYSAVDGVFDFILANPPYLSRARLERIEQSVLEHEPVAALFAEDDGYALIDATIVGLPAHLTPGGQCWVEHEPEHAHRILESAAGLGYQAENRTDQYGILRYSVILTP